MALLPPSMKSWILTGSGDPKDVLELKTEWPTPAAPTGSNLLIKVSYAALNPLDLVMMHGSTTFKKSNPVPAVDFAGEVLQVGPSVHSTTPDIRVGMTVCGTLPTMQILRGYGVLSEYIVLPSHAVAEKPASLDDGPASALMGVGGQTTVILMRAANVPKGARVLLSGASGGVGTLLLQALHAKGVHVTAISSGKNEAMVRQLGAEEVSSNV